VLKPRRNLNLAPEPLNIHAGGQLWRQELYDNLSTERAVGRDKNAAHPPAAELSLDVVSVREEVSQSFFKWIHLAGLWFGGEDTAPSTVEIDFPSGIHPPPISGPLAGLIQNGHGANFPYGKAARPAAAYKGLPCINAALLNSRLMPASVLVQSPLRAEIARLLEEARSRTLLLVAGLSDEDLHRQHDPLMSPIIWDLGHIAHFEELWLTQNLDGPIEFSEMPGMYNPFEHPRATRAALPIPPLADMLVRLGEIREQVLNRLESVDFDDTNPLTANGHVYHMVLQHEYQHNETILQTLQLKLGDPYDAPRISPPSASATPPVAGMVTVNAGLYSIGTDDRTESYDNERPRHDFQVRAYEIDRTPVTNGDYGEFIAAGGYTDSRCWSEAGRKWLTESGAFAPKYWIRDGDSWTVRSMNKEGVVDPSRPVCHVSFHEADAFAKWAGKRLPTEVEWEIAASWNPADKSARKFPWGDSIDQRDANVDQLLFGTTPVGTYSRNVSPLGCYGMIGDVWEWTSSDFGGHPGFSAFPYREYSEEFFGTDYKVLRGGSWATRSGAIRNTFRNWDYPIRRQIFSGFRCARSI